MKENEKTLVEKDKEHVSKGQKMAIDFEFKHLEVFGVNEARNWNGLTLLENKILEEFCKN